VAAKADSLTPGPTRPVGSPEIPQFYLPGGNHGDARTYTPYLYGAARIQFGDRKRGLEETRRVAFLVRINPTGRTIDWDAARPTDVMPEHLLKETAIEGEYLPLSNAAAQIITFTRWAKSFDRWIARTQRVELTTKQDPPEAVTVAPKRGGGSVELVAIVWELG